VLLLGADSWHANDATLAGSEYLAHVHDLVIGKPNLDLNAEARLQRLLIALAGERLLRSAHDCSDGGLAVAIAESAIIGGKGFRSDAAEQSPPETPGRWDAALFGEAASRAVVSCAPEHAASVERLATEHGVPALRLGAVGGGRVSMAGLVDEPLAGLTDAYEGGLERALTEG